ncbi:hypothetical protein MNV_1840012 [Candidatus Methanoperedens nitroreducens]|uniref:Uncharacterized protein n=1 Tax=Candidatus Methanoperedens nitratireducens TaxID=1392998 RepID=A0A284VMS0_9EURY|nr:hypothetical protein MNV_1840012 [Candidatus Methanoperedens nitroreducens]
MTVQSNDQKQIGTSPLYFHWEVNLSKKTYKTTKLPISDLVKRMPTDTKIENNKDDLTSDAYTVAVTSGTYTATVGVITDDAVGEDLSETTHQISWTVNSGGTVSYNWRSVSAWAANPSSFDTHWYVDTYGFIGKFREKIMVNSTIGGVLTIQENIRGCLMAMFMPTNRNNVYFLFC